MKTLSDLKGQAKARRPAGGRLLARLRCGDEGQSIVEFAFMLPVLLIIITGMASIAMGLTAYEQLGEATFAGSQIFQDGRGMLSSFSPPNDPCALAAAKVAAALPSWTPGNFTYTVQIWSNWTSSSSTPAYSQTFVGTSAATCSGAYTDLTQFQPATLTVSYKYVWSGIFWFSLGTGNITQSKTVLVE